MGGTARPPKTRGRKSVAFSVRLEKMLGRDAPQAPIGKNKKCSSGGEDGNESVYGLSFQLVLVRFIAYAINPVIKDAEYKEGIAHHWNSVHYVDYFP